MKLKKIFCLAAIAVVAMAFAGIDAKRAKAEMTVIENKAKAAFHSENHAYLCGLLADNFTWKHSKGKPDENKKQSCDGLKMFFKQCDNIRVSWTDKSFAVKGNTVTVESDQTMTCTTMGKDKKRHTMKGMSSSRETWMKTNKGWRATMFEDIGTEKMWMDGKPFDPSKMGGGGG